MPNNRSLSPPDTDTLSSAESSPRSTSEDHKANDNIFVTMIKNKQVETAIKNNKKKFSSSGHARLLNQLPETKEGTAWTKSLENKLNKLNIVDKNAVNEIGNNLDEKSNKENEKLLIITEALKNNHSELFDYIYLLMAVIYSDLYCGGYTYKEQDQLHKSIRNILPNEEQLNVSQFFNSILVNFAPKIVGEEFTSAIMETADNNLKEAKILSSISQYQENLSATGIEGIRVFLEKYENNHRKRQILQFKENREEYYNQLISENSQSIDESDPGYTGSDSDSETGEICNPADQDNTSSATENVKANSTSFAKENSPLGLFLNTDPVKKIISGNTEKYKNDNTRLLNEVCPAKNLKATEKDNLNSLRQQLLYAAIENPIINRLPKEITFKGDFFEKFNKKTNTSEQVQFISDDSDSKAFFEFYCSTLAAFDSQIKKEIEPKNYEDLINTIITNVSSKEKLDFLLNQNLFGDQATAGRNECTSFMLTFHSKFVEEKSKSELGLRSSLQALFNEQKLSNGGPILEDMKKRSEDAQKVIAQIDALTKKGLDSESTKKLTQTYLRYFNNIDGNNGLQEKMDNLYKTIGGLKDSDYSETPLTSTSEEVQIGSTKISTKLLNNFEKNKEEKTATETKAMAAQEDSYSEPENIDVAEIDANNFKNIGRCFTTSVVAATSLVAGSALIAANISSSASWLVLAGFSAAGFAVPGVAIALAAIAVAIVITAAIDHYCNEGKLMEKVGIFASKPVVNNEDTAHTEADLPTQH